MSELSFEKQERIDLIGLKEELRAGKQPRIEGYLEQDPDLVEQLFKTLLDLEIQLLRQQHKLDYVPQFPQFKTVVEETLLAPTVKQECQADEAQWLGPYKILQPIGRRGWAKSSWPRSSNRSSVG